MGQPRIKVTARKYLGDDLCSWAVFRSDQATPVVSGLSKNECPYYKRQVLALIEKERTIIKVVCQFCGRHYADKPGEGMTGTSHGTCPTCVAAPQHERCGFPQWYCEKMGTCQGGA